MRHPRFYHLKEFSDYEEPSYTQPLILCAVVVVTALLVFCLCKKTMAGPGRMGGGCNACSASAKATRNEEARDGVVHARDGAHLEELLATDGAVVLFWAPWCGHCAQMKPDFQAAGEEHTEMLYVMCDCENSVGQETLQKHGIEAFPTIRYYAHGKMVAEHTGPRSKEAIMAWAQSM